MVNKILWAIRWWRQNYYELVCVCVRVRAWVCAWLRVCVCVHARVCVFACVHVQVGPSRSRWAESNMATQCVRTCVPSTTSAAPVNTWAPSTLTPWCMTRSPSRCCWTSSDRSADGSLFPLSNSKICQFKTHQICISSHQLSVSIVGTGSTHTFTIVARIRIRISFIVLNFYKQGMCFCEIGA